MLKILILNGQYLPGYKGGGPIQSCYNMIENLSDRFEFYVLTADRDYKSVSPYENIKIDDWNQVGAAKVFYMSPQMQSFRGFQKIINNTDFDIMYLNGFFSQIFTIRPLILKRLGKLKNFKVILTPRGDFTGGCENKKFKKYSYIYFCKLIGLYKNILWHATSDLEKKDIKEKFKKAEIVVAPNLSAKYIPKTISTYKVSGELKLVFVSRIFPKKNIKFALEVLNNINEGNVIFDIYGPMEDKQYWAECLEIIRNLPRNIKVTYKGELPHSEVGRVFEQYHAFFFPTLGENYGHVIVEAMMNNCVAILSKGVTPWDDYISLLDTGAYLTNPAAFRSILKKLISINNNEFINLIRINNEYVMEKINNDTDVRKYTPMLKDVYSL